MASTANVSQNISSDLMTSHCAHPGNSSAVGDEVMQHAAFGTCCATASSPGPIPTTCAHAQTRLHHHNESHHQLPVISQFELDRQLSEKNALLLPPSQELQQYLPVVENNTTTDFDLDSLSHASAASPGLLTKSGECQSEASLRGREHEDALLPSRSGSMSTPGGSSLSDSGSLWDFLDVASPANCDALLGSSVDGSDDCAPLEDSSDDACCSPPSKYDSSGSPATPTQRRKKLFFGCPKHAPPSKGR